MRRPSAALALLLAACTVREVPGDGTSTGTTADPTTATSTGTSSIPTSTSNTTTTPTPTTGTTTPTLPGFAIDPDLPGPGIKCDGLKQLDPECPPGQKCTIDGYLGYTHCVDIVDDPKGLYEPCTTMGDGWTGLDDCGLGMICWDTDEEGHGICHGLCDGTYEHCQCTDPKADPSFCQDCAIGICFPWCDPLMQDCNEDFLCIPNGVGFLCVLDASGDEGQVNDPCEFANSCDKGLVCLNTAAAASACMPGSQGCCQPFCNFANNDPCPNPDQQCVQWFDPMMPISPGLEDVGICAIPS